MALFEPFDLQNLLVNTFAGSPIIFIALASIFFSGLAAKFRMNMYTYGLVMLLFSIFMAVIAGWLVLSFIIIGSIIIYLIIAKRFN